MAVRDYSSDRISVHWDSALCIHTAMCMRANPRVFDNRRRPWIDVTLDEADAVADAVRRCPTGALTYRRLDGGDDEHYDDVSITVVPGGPLYVRGPVHLTDADGTPIPTFVRTALCRCGATSNAPYCDGSHRRLERG